MSHQRQASTQSLPKPTRGDSRVSLRSIARHSTSSFGGTGRVGTLTPHQASVLASFRQAIETEHILASDDSLGTDDATLLRFLRARNFALQKSLEMLRDCQKWRKAVCDIGMDDLYETKIDPFDYPHREEVFKYWPLYFHGVSRLGLPINIQHFGKIDLKALYHHVDKDLHWRSVVANCEALPRECMPACSEAAGTRVEGAFCIVDLKGFSIFQFWGFRSMAQRLFQISQDYFPETMGKVLVINAPGGFATIWKVIRPWLAPATVAKINILGSDYQKELHSLCDPDQLPEIFGGTCRCPNGGCMLNSPGPWQDARKRLGKETARKGRNRAHLPDPLEAGQYSAPGPQSSGHPPATGTRLSGPIAEEPASPASNRNNGSASPARQPSTPSPSQQQQQQQQQAPPPPPAAPESPTPTTKPADAGAHETSSPDRRQQTPVNGVHAAHPHPESHAKLDPRLAPAIGQGKPIKRQTSHGVERVLANGQSLHSGQHQDAADKA